MGKKLNSLEDLGEAVKEQKPKKKKVVAVIGPRTKTRIIQIVKGLKEFR